MVMPFFFYTDKTNNDDTEDLILNSAIDEAVKSLNKGKSAGVDNIPGELI